MFKELQKVLTNFFTTQRILFFIVVITLIVLLYSYSKSKNNILDLMEDGTDTHQQKKQNITSPSEISSVQPADPITQSSISNYDTRPVANPQDLLPKDANSKWGELNTLNQGTVVMPDLLEAGYHIGLDTIGQTLRNANMQERSDPIIPKMEVGPWNTSTIEPDYGRIPLEVGYGPR
jgi:hypothetical protein